MQFHTHDVLEALYDPTMETTSKYAHVHSTANLVVELLTIQDDPAAQNTVRPRSFEEAELNEDILTTSRMKIGVDFNEASDSVFKQGHPVILQGQYKLN
jgi:hypothetical protein